MILTCSNCAKRYLVDARALGTPGRRVRCASCGHTWFQAAPPDAPQPVEAPPLAETPAARTDASQRIQLPALPRRGGRGRWLGPAAALIVLAIIVGGAVGERGRVVRAWPPAARLYAMVGLGIAVPGAGLELRNVTPSRGVENGIPTLAIDGEVVNVSPVARDVPKLHVALQDANDRELKSWTIAVDSPQLLPGASASFHTTIQKPPDGATGVVVSFAPGGG